LFTQGTNLVLFDLYNFNIKGHFRLPHIILLTPHPKTWCEWWHHTFSNSL